MQTCPYVVNGELCVDGTPHKLFVYTLIAVTPVRTRKIHPPDNSSTCHPYSLHSSTARCCLEPPHQSEESHPRSLTASGIKEHNLDIRNQPGSQDTSVCPPTGILKMSVMGPKGQLSLDTSMLQPKVSYLSIAGALEHRDARHLQH